MTQPTGSREFDPNTVRKVVSVRAPQKLAWQVFTGEIDAGAKYLVARGYR